MDPVTVIKGVQAVAGLFGAFKKQPDPTPKLDLGLLRREAQENGFNPASVLRLTGGAGFQTSAQPTPNVFGALSGVAGAIGDVIQSNRDYKQAKAESDARIGLMEAQSSGLLSANSPSGSRPSTFRAMGPVTTKIDENGNLYPVKMSRFAGMPAAEIPFWDVRSLAGEDFKIRGDVLERLGIGSGSTLVTEDWEAILGEIGGEISGISEIIKGGLSVGQQFLLTNKESAELDLDVSPVPDLREASDDAQIKEMQDYLNSLTFDGTNPYPTGG